VDFFFPLYSLLEIPELFPLEKCAKTEKSENKSTPSEQWSIWPNTVSKVADYKCLKESA